MVGQVSFLSRPFTPTDPQKNNAVGRVEILGGAASEGSFILGEDISPENIALEKFKREQERKHNEEYDRLREASALPRPNDPIMFDERS